MLPASLSAPVPTSIARGLVFLGNLLHSVGASLLATRNDELADELATMRAELEQARAELEHLGAVGTAAAAAVVDELERQGAVIVVDQLEATHNRCGADCPGWCEHQDTAAAGVDEHQGAAAAVVDEHQGAELAGVDDPDWLGFGGPFPENLSGKARL